MKEIEINPHLTIPESELTFRASRSSGPGGQNVNKVATRVSLTFDVANSPSLDAGQRQRILKQLGKRVNKEGILVIHCSERRSQAANRILAMERFAKLLSRALRTHRQRRPTSVPEAAHERRIREKKQRGQLKTVRSQIPSQEE